MAENLLDDCEEVRREDESCASKGYVYENNCERYTCEWGDWSAGKYIFETTTERSKMPVAGEVLQSHDAGG